MGNRTEDSSQVLSVGACGSQIGRDFVVKQHQAEHTPNIAFRHLPPNSARFGYATEGARFISAQLSTDAVSALRKVRVLIYDCKSNLAPKHARKHEAHPPRVKKEFTLDSNDFWFYLSWRKQRVQL